MLKLLLTTMIILNVFYTISANTLNFEAPVAKVMFLKLIKDKCYPNATEMEYEAFTSLTENTLDCIKFKAKEAPIFVTSVKDFKYNIQVCSDKFIDKLQQCLPEESRDWAQLNFDIIYSLIDFLYEKKDQLLSSSFRTFIESCVENFQQDAAKIEAAQCFLGYDTNKLEKRVLCENLTTMEKCILTQVNKKCPGDAAIEKLKVDFFMAIKKPLC